MTTTPDLDREPLAEGREHLTVSGRFQSDRYPGTPAGKVPLSTKDPLAQDLLWRYAERHEAAGKHGDSEFPRDLKEALRNAGFEPADADPDIAELRRAAKMRDDCNQCLEIDTRLFLTLLDRLDALEAERDRARAALNLAVSRGCNHCADSIREARKVAGVIRHEPKEPSHDD